MNTWHPCVHFSELGIERWELGPLVFCHGDKGLHVLSKYAEHHGWALDRERLLDLHSFRHIQDLQRQLYAALADRLVIRPNLSGAMRVAMLTELAHSSGHPSGPIW